MSVKSKVLASGATLAMMAGGFGATAMAANAATPSCGSGCTTFYTEGWGSGSVLDVYKANGAVNQKIILWIAGNNDRAEDFVISDEGTVHQFYKAGLASAALNLHYKSDEAVEIEYAPYGVDSGLCVSAESRAGNGTAVVLQACGTAPRTVWVEDAKDVASGSDYAPLINGSDTNFSDPYVLTNRSGVLYTHQLESDDGTYADNQLWAQESGVL
jgi:hypothetical protein